MNIDDAATALTLSRALAQIDRSIDIATSYQGESNGIFYAGVGSSSAGLTSDEFEPVRAAFLTALQEHRQGVVDAITALGIDTFKDTGGKTVLNEVRIAESTQLGGQTEAQV